MEIMVIPAAIGDKPVLRNMMELYMYDFSESEGWDLDEHGLFGYRRLDHYWMELGRHPFLARVDGKLAGFALVRVEDPDGAEPIAHVAEFFVLRKYRRLGVGERMAREVFRRFPGAWSVNQLERNVTAQAFWRRVIGRATDGQYDEQHDGETGRVTQTFRVGEH